MIPTARTPALALLGALVAVGGCGFDRGDRWYRATDDTTRTSCAVGSRSCGADGVMTCIDGPDGPAWQRADDCGSRGLVCAPSLVECTRCVPGTHQCDGNDAQACSADGSGFETVQSCDGSAGIACRDGSCLDLCGLARKQRSNVGCEYWAVDLDNANIDASLNAAAQQYAVVVSNPQPDLAAMVTIEQDDTIPGAEGAPAVIASATVLPSSLQVFRLGPREVDGSPPGEFDTGTHSALTRAAYRIRTTVPVVAYQFNPLENVNVFSNDASLLKPTEALIVSPGNLLPAYVVLGWPQTIAATDDPDTNFNPSDPMHLRAFLTIVGTRPGTHVRVTPRARVVGGPGIAETAAGATLEVSLDAFDVANLETGAFNADFTGSLVEADQPIVVFSGGEASDAPTFARLAERRCCADHLEEQLDPLRTAGTRFVAAVSPNRSAAITAAGADIGTVESKDFFRVIAATDAGATVRTTLSGDYSRIELAGLGDHAQIDASSDFIVESDAPIMLSSVSPSQDAAGVPSGLPGGDPSFLIIPPVEQYRHDYVFLTPDKYSFDFVRLMVPVDTDVRMDGEDLSSFDCESRKVEGVAPGSAGFTVYRCQLSFPVLDTSLEASRVLSPGRQNDGVHVIVASRPVGVLVNGFDRNVSYAYAAGTDLTEIVLR